MTIASKNPFVTLTRLKRANRPIPWFISPSLKNGFRMYCLLSSQVFTGEGKSGARRAGRRSFLCCSPSMSR